MRFDIALESSSDVIYESHAKSSIVWLVRASTHSHHHQQQPNLLYIDHNTLPRQDPF